MATRSCLRGPRDARLQVLHASNVHSPQASFTRVERRQQLNLLFFETKRLQVANRFSGVSLDMFYSALLDFAGIPFPHPSTLLLVSYYQGWLGSRVVSVLDSGDAVG